MAGSPDLLSVLQLVDCIPARFAMPAEALRVEKSTSEISSRDKVKDNCAWWLASSTARPIYTL
jgi:hypothetical protein